MQIAPISFDRFNALADADAHERIRAARARLGDKAVLLCHHYQRADVYQYADITGDSLKLSRLAAETDAEYIVFCGVHFMAEVADIMTKPHQQAILPDLAAGCSMADMANLAVASGFTNAYNILEGFEGDKDASGHRNKIGGWRHASLPWTQG